MQKTPKSRFVLQSTVLNKAGKTQIILIITRRSYRITENDSKTVVRFFVALYSPTLNTEEDKVARQILFREIDLLREPFLLIHLILFKSTSFDHVTNQETGQLRLGSSVLIQIPSVLWGWQKSGKCLVHLWSDASDASGACRRIIMCG